MKKVLVLGCTGSIGTNTLDIIRNFPNDFSVAGLTAHSNEKKLAILCQEFKCEGFLTSKEKIENLNEFIERTKPDIVVNGIAGSAGLLPSKIVFQDTLQVLKDLHQHQLGSCIFLLFEFLFCLVLFLFCIFLHLISMPFSYSTFTNPYSH